MTADCSRYVSETHVRSIAAIKRVVAKDYAVKPEALDAPGRAQPAALARQIAMHFCRKLLTEPVPFKPSAHAPISFPSISAAFNRENHGTAMHACSEIARKYALDRYFAARVDRLAAEVFAELKKERAA